MKRKTNLFYGASSQDSKFLTFSNYTESLTGNLMSTDNKIYPSSFLCIKMDKLSSLESATEAYKEFEDNILDSEEVKYVLKTEIYDYLINPENNTDLIKTYVLNGKKCKSGLVISNEEFDFLYRELTDNNCKVVVNFIRNDKNNTLVGQDDNGIGTDKATISIDKTYLEYKDEPGFIANPQDTLSIYLYNKQRLIDKLMSKYENKMATLRDWCIKNNMNQEENLLPLNYLLETLLEFDSDMKINYIGDVTEQDWNGTFADTICVVDSSKFNSGKIVMSSNENNSKIMVDVTSSSSKTYLYGWYVKTHPYIEELDFDHDGKNTISIKKTNENHLYNDILAGQTKEYVDEFKRTHELSTSDTDDYNAYIIENANSQPEDYQDTLDAIIKASEIKEEYVGPSQMKALAPEYDNTENGNLIYDISSDIHHIEYIKHTNEDIEFDLLIPLYDIVDMNYMTNSTYIEEVTYMPMHNADEKKRMYVKNVPLGMWFSGEESVKLTVDKSTGFSPTWSLALSSQFKPFPNSSYMPDELTEDAKKEAFLTFAQIMSRQNEILDKFSDMTKLISNMSNRISTLESSIGAVLTSYNIDGIRKEIVDLKNSLESKITRLESTIDDNQLKWTDKE